MEFITNVMTFLVLDDTSSFFFLIIMVDTDGRSK